MTTKPEIRIAPIADTVDILPAASKLSALKPTASRHETRDWRHPLGVYNLSVARICDKLSKCANRLYAFWTQPNGGDDVRGEIIDYLELAMYAAAEHVDDVERIAATFFNTDRDAAQSREVRLFRQNIKPVRDEISSFTNMIKHQHGRIRLFQIDFSHHSQTIPLLGFFVEGFKGGTVSPNPILHDGGKVIISLTSFLWNILTYVWQMSAELARFLQQIAATDEAREKISDTPSYRRAVIQLSRLPLYSFDEEHPFDRVEWSIVMDSKMKAEAASQVYGSLSNQWTNSSDGHFGNFQVMYASDGVTRRFNIVRPKRLRIRRWAEGPIVPKPATGKP